MDDTYPGIEIRVLPPGGVGDPWFTGNSHDLHFELAAAWLHLGYPADTWHPVAAGPMVLEIRAVELPGLPTGEEILGELAAQDQAAADVDQAPDVDQAAAERCCVCGRAQVDYRNFRDQPFCWPCADGNVPAAEIDQAAADQATDDYDRAAAAHERATRAMHAAAAELAARRRLHTCSSCPSPEGCAAFAACFADVDQAAAAAEHAGQTAAPVPEVDTGAVALTAGQPRSRLADLGRAIARIARRARFRSGRCTCRAAPR